MSAMFAGMAMPLALVLMLNGHYLEAAFAVASAVVLALLNIGEQLREGRAEQRARDRRGER